MVETTGTLTQWMPAEAPSVELSYADIHAWRWHLAPEPGVLQGLSKLLSPDESHRAERFHFQRHREHYITGRGTLRVILSRYLGCQPDELEFEYGGFGKPQLRGSELQFNLAHSGDYAVLALNSGEPVGIDIEATRLPQDADALVQRFFAPREAALFRTLPPEEKPEAFMNLWTRKEAWLKATGQGISHLLADVEVSFLPGSAPRLLRINAPHFEVVHWHFLALPQWPGYTTALATSSNCLHPHCFSWRHYES